ncbi:CLUMA_CG002173, isoform A [Clunio marinus]|uniref:CLUMA_CG002173, isoform A n=1 Tax=Clunio marinus TaxID=568069 RepID=A0A1J1HLW4_9DIPT|nr:CLUMA_CG002173, isoform A [Clunio marinus]
MCLSSIFKRKAAKDLSSDNPYGHLLLKKRPAVSFAPDTKVEKHFSAPENVIKREPGASDESSNVQRPNSSAPSSILVRTCKVGGRKAKLSVQFTSVSNVISKSLLRKLEAEKFKYFTYDMIPCKIGIMEFIGQVTSDIEINEKVVNIVFYVQEGNSDQVTINPKTARQLGL